MNCAMIILLLQKKIKVTPEMLSPYCKNIQETFGSTIGQVAKLIQTLAEKTNYVLHYRNFRLYLHLGLKLKKIHRVLKFDQHPWLRQYIDLNTKKRTNIMHKTHLKRTFLK